MPERVPKRHVDKAGSRNINRRKVPGSGQPGGNFSRQIAGFHPRRLGKDHCRIGRNIAMRSITRWLHTNAGEIEIATKRPVLLECFQHTGNNILKVAENIHLGLQIIRYDGSGAPYRLAPPRSSPFRRKSDCFRTHWARLRPPHAGQKAADVPE